MTGGIKRGLPCGSRVFVYGLLCFGNAILTGVNDCRDNTKMERISMIRPTVLLTFLLASLLTACGGDSGGSVVGSSSSSDSSGGTTTVDNGDGTTSDVTTSTQITNPKIGTGSGSTFTAGALLVSNATLSAGGTTTISATIVDADNGNAKVVSQTYGVVFTSICSEADPAKASFSRDSSVTSSGEVSVTYEAQGCTGTDIISFKLYSAVQGSTGGSADSIDTTSVLAAATGTIVVQPPEVGAITYVETSDPAISISAIGNPVLPKLTTVTFKVLDQTNNPIDRKDVSFELTNTTGGVSLALAEGTTNEDGIVKAVVLAGTTHAVTSVRATTLANDGVTKISTDSQPISVTTGIVDQDSFSVAIEAFNPGAFNVDGVKVSVSAYAADQYQNPVADGTTINFTAESGSIDSFCTTVAGRCSVTWNSSGTRPGQHDAGLGRVNEIDGQTGTTVLGMTTILAYTQGESGFTDSNNDGLFNASELFVTYPEAFRDDNWNGALDTDSNSAPVEFFEDFNHNSTYDAAPTTYQGATCTTTAKGLGHCDSMMNVRASVRFVQSVAESAVIRLFTKSGSTYTEVTNNPPALSAPGTFYVVLQDSNGNIPASGTSLNVNGDGYKITGSSGQVPNSIGILDPTGALGLPSYGVLYVVSYKADTSPVSITVEASSGDFKTSVELN